MRDVEVWGYLVSHLSIFQTVEGISNLEILLCCVEGMLLLLSDSAQYNSYTAGLIQAGDWRLACFVYRILWATFDYIALDTVLLVVYTV